MEKKSTYSFDVFDTCICRTCGTPANFFDILSTKVFTNPIPENIRQAFIMTRHEIEEKAYAESSRSNIYDIYDKFSFCHPDILPKDKILQLELQLEREVLVPILETKRRIDYLRSKGHRILFISDMYLPASFIQERLEAFGMFLEGDKLFVSCETGYNKYSNEIYRHIHDTENIVYNNWNHSGDNYKCDYERPRELGITASLTTHGYSDYQQRWCNQCGKSTYKTGCIVAGISRSLNLSTPYHPRKLLLTDVVAPLYCSFVSHIFRDATQRGIKKLFFCARDTYQMFQVAKVIGNNYPNIDCGYLYISRKALKKESEENILGYLIQEGLASKEYNSAIIDSSSSGTTHYVVNKVVSNHGYRSVFGYYFAKWAHSEYVINNTQVDSCYNGRYIIRESTYSMLFKTKYLLIIEDIFSANTDKKTFGYKKEDDKYVPIFLDEIDDENTIQEGHSELQSYTTELLQRYAQIFMNFGLDKKADEILYQIAIPTLVSFLNRPTREYTRSLLTCKQILDGKCLPIVKKESLFHLLRTKGRDTAWNRATFYYSLPGWSLKWLDRLIERREQKM